MDWRASADKSDLIIVWQEEGGPNVAADEIVAGTGTAIVDRLLATGTGSIKREWTQCGLKATITVPARRGG